MIRRKKRAGPGTVSEGRSRLLKVLGTILGLILSLPLIVGLMLLEERHVIRVSGEFVLLAVVILATVGGTGLPWLVRYLTQRPTPRPAERLGPADRRRWSVWRDTISHVQFSSLYVEREDRDVRVVLEGRRAIPGLTLSRLWLSTEVGSPIGGGTGGQGILTGDRQFDDGVYAEGEEAVLLAVLDRQARAKITHLLTGWDAELRAGRLVVRAELELADTPASLQALLAAVRDAGEALRLDARRVPERLARNAGEDPVPDVRLRNLAALLAAFPNAAAARDASRAALTAPDPVMRMTAAAFLGPEASATLRALAESDSPQPHIRLAAAIQYVLTVPVPEALAFLVKLRPELASLATRAEATGADSTLLGNAVERLAALDDAGREPVVIELLAQAPGPVQVAAAQGLGRMGSVAAVEPLLSCAGRWNAELADVTRTAVAAIQARLGDVEAGRLSVATPAAAAGGLTAAEPDPTGALSPTPASRTRPSPTPKVRGETG